jgi:zinc transport system substrate-binding protein
MQSADVILTNGATYEKWIDQVSLPPRRVINTSASFTDRYLEVAGTLTHTHGPEGEHSHEGTAFTTWLDPGLAALQAESIAEAFSGRWPASAAAFQDNLTALRADLEQLDQDLRDALAAVGGAPLLASHPVYQYLASSYGLDLESVTWEPEEMPSEPAWRVFRVLRARHSARWMIWEAEPIPEINARLAELNIRALVFAPLGNRPADGDYLAGMSANVRRLRAMAAQ